MHPAHPKQKGRLLLLTAGAQGAPAAAGVTAYPDTAASYSSRRANANPSVAPVTHAAAVDVYTNVWLCCCELHKSAGRRRTLQRSSGAQDTEAKAGKKDAESERNVKNCGQTLHSACTPNFSVPSSVIVSFFGLIRLNTD